MSISPDYFKQHYGLSTTHSEVQAWVEAGHLNHGHVLDLGCGRGRNALYLAKHGFDVHACDADEASIATLNHIIAAENMANIETDVKCVTNPRWTEPSAITTRPANVCCTTDETI